MSASGSVEVYEIDDDNNAHETVVVRVRSLNAASLSPSEQRTLRHGAVVSERRVPMTVRLSPWSDDGFSNLAEQIAIWQRLADDRLNMLVTAQNKITFLEREAARHVAQIEKAVQPLPRWMPSTATDDDLQRNALVAVKAEAEASAVRPSSPLAGRELIANGTRSSSVSRPLLDTWSAPPAMSCCAIPSCETCALAAVCNTLTDLQPHPLRSHGLRALCS